MARLGNRAYRGEVWDDQRGMGIAYYYVGILTRKMARLGNRAYRGEV